MAAKVADLELGGYGFKRKARGKSKVQKPSKPMSSARLAEGAKPAPREPARVFLLPITIVGRIGGWFDVGPQKPPVHDSQELGFV